MNANAYGGELGQVLEWVDVCSGEGAERRAPGRARVRLPALEPGPGRGRLAGLLPARRGRSGGDQGHPGRDARHAARGPAVGDQDLRLDVQEPGRRPAPGSVEPRASCWRRPDAAAFRSGGARFSDVHANFVENAGERDHRRHPRADGRGPPPGPRALRGRARARGPDPRRGRVARGLGAWPADPESRAGARRGQGPPASSANHARVRHLRLDGGRQAASARAREPRRAERRSASRSPGGGRDRKPTTRTRSRGVDGDRAAQPLAPGPGSRSRLRSARAARRCSSWASSRRWRSPTSPGFATPRWWRSGTSRWRVSSSSDRGRIVTALTEPRRR